MDASLVPPKRSELSTALFAVAVSAWVLYAPGFLGPIGWGLDDASMYLRYAENILRGEGIRWNPGGPYTYGTTSLLYLFLVTLAKPLISTPPAAPLMWISWGASLCFILVLSRMLFVHLASPQLSRNLWVPGFSVAWLAAHPTFIASSRNGMETSLALLTNSIFLLCTLRWIQRCTWGSTVITCVAGWITFLARPEHLLFWALFPPLAVLSRGKNVALKPLLWFGSVSLLLLILDSVAKFALFGDPLPLPFYVKTSGFYEGYIGYHGWNWVEYFSYLLMLASPFLIMMIVTWTHQAWLVVLPALAPLLIACVYFSQTVQIMGFYGRYYIPALPFIVWAGWRTVDLWLLQGKPGALSIRLGIAVATVIATLTALPLAESTVSRSLSAKEQPLPTPPARYPKLGWHRALDGFYSLLHGLEPGTKIAATEHGTLGALFPDLVIIDMTGLHNPTIAYGGFSTAAILDESPTLIWLPDWVYTGAVKKLTDDETFQSHYEFYPGLFDYGVAIDRRHPNFKELRENVEVHARRVYETETTRSIP